MKKTSYYLTALLALAQFPLCGFETAKDLISLNEQTVKNPPPKIRAQQAPLTDSCSSCDRADRWMNIYVGVEGGFNWAIASSVEGYKPNVDMGYCVGGLVGYQFPKGVAVEAEVTYRNNAVDYVNYFGLHIGANHHIWSLSYMGNILYELPYWCWKPFAGVGVGYSTVHAKVTKYHLPSDKNTDNFTYQCFVGFDYNVYCGLDVGVEYKFLHTLNSEIDNHALMLDIKWYW